MTKMETSSLGENSFGLSLNSLSLAGSSSDSLLQDGHVILGGDTEYRYVTHYRIDLESQIEALKRRRHSGCLTHPDGKKKTTGKCIWDVIRSEKCLIGLHIITLAIGSAKTALRFKEIDEDLETIHAGLEVALTVFIVAIRLVSVVYHCQKVEEQRKQFEVNNSERVIAAERTKRVHLTIAAGCGILMTNLIAFFLLLFLPGGDLQWTVLTNNFTLILVTAVVGRTLSLLSLEGHMIEVDHQKAVIYESIMHLGHCLNQGSGAGLKKALAQAENFCEALKNTEALAQPTYLTCHNRRSQPDWQAINTMVVVSNM